MIINQHFSKFFPIISPNDPNPRSGEYYCPICFQKLNGSTYENNIDKSRNYHCNNNYRRRDNQDSHRFSLIGSNKFYFWFDLNDKYICNINYGEHVKKAYILSSFHLFVEPICSFDINDIDLIDNLNCFHLGIKQIEERAETYLLFS
jgi:hypothetical protein